MSFWTCSCGRKVFGNLKECPYCKSPRGKVNVSPKVSIAVVLLAVVVFSVVAFVKSNSKVTQPIYKDSMNIDILRTLSANKISDCGMVRWAENLDRLGEYSVKCSNDGETWTTYLVWPSLNKVSSPSNREVVKAPASTEGDSSTPSMEKIDCLKDCKALPPEQINACEEKCRARYK